jgi:hypothetical protein
MVLPSNLLDVWEETAVVGDVEAFMDYLESGQAAQDYKGCLPEDHIRRQYSRIAGAMLCLWSRDKPAPCAKLYSIHPGSNMPISRKPS